MRKDRERERECVNIYVCVCVLMLFVTESPPSVSKNPRAAQGGGGQERRRRRRRRADLSTSPHCGTRGAAAGDSKPTVILDSRV